MQIPFWLTLPFHMESEVKNQTQIKSNKSKASNSGQTYLSYTSSSDYMCFIVCGSKEIIEYSHDSRGQPHHVHWVGPGLSELNREHRNYEQPLVKAE